MLAVFALGAQQEGTVFPLYLSTACVGKAKIAKIPVHANIAKIAATDASLLVRCPQTPVLLGVVMTSTPPRQQ